MLPGPLGTTCRLQLRVHSLWPQTKIPLLLPPALQAESRKTGDKPRVTCMCLNVSRLSRAAYVARQHELKTLALPLGLIDRVMNASMTLLPPRRHTKEYAFHALLRQVIDRSVTCASHHDMVITENRTFRTAGDCLAKHHRHGAFAQQFPSCRSFDVHVPAVMETLALCWKPLCSGRNPHVVLESLRF